MSALLDLSGLGLRRGGRAVLDEVSLRIAPGELVGLIGPNGAGKTTLMRAALGLVPARGASSLLAMTPAVRARHVAWLPQTREIAWPVAVEAVVALGRLPHLPPGGWLSVADRQAVAGALARCDLTALRDRPATALSGGEQARVLIARALAQDTPLVLADEPVAGLDPGHQIAAMELFAGLAAAGRAAMVALHDLGLAVRHCTRIVMMDKGRIVADGAPAEVLAPDMLAAVFGIRAHAAQTADGPVFQPVARVAGAAAETAAGAGTAAAAGAGTGAQAGRKRP